MQDQSIPRGLCECGCGQPAPLSKQNVASRGMVKGQPMRFRVGHNSRRNPIAWISEDRGYTTPCHIWQRSTNNNGYGLEYSRAAGRQFYAHRLAYERAYGPIPNGREIDHLCRNRPCVNPEHLQAVTRRENVRRSTTNRHGAMLLAVKLAVATTTLRRVDVADMFGMSKSNVIDMVSRSCD